MGRKNLFELLSSMSFDVYNESDTLLDLFRREQYMYNGSYRQSLMEYIDKNFFRDMPFRGTSISMEKTMIKLGIFNPSSDFDKLFLLCEFLVHLFSKLRSYHHLYICFPLQTQKYLPIKTKRLLK